MMMNCLLKVRSDVFCIAVELLGKEQYLDVQYSYEPPVVNHRFGHPDSWMPDEPEELIIYSVFLTNKESGPGKINIDISRLVDADFKERIEEALKDEQPWKATI